MERSALTVNGARRTADHTLRIAVLSASDPNDRGATSGTPFYMCRALSARGHSLVPLGPFHPFAERWRRVRHQGSRLLFGARWPYEHDAALADAYARGFASRLRALGTVDAVFAPFASSELSALEIPYPVVYAGDATVPLLHDYHPGFSALSPTYAEEARAVERRALARAAVVSYPSAWAAQSARDQCGVDAARLVVAPFGPNLDRVPTHETVRQAKERTDGAALLFVGTNWQAKGGPIAVRAIDLARARGLPLTLTVVGTVPPTADRRPWMTVIPRLDKNEPTQQETLRSLLLDARLLFVPTRNDCYGIVFAEAAACGTPSLATDTGGVSAAVIEGITGHLLAPTAKAEEYADRIVTLLSDPAGIAALSASARAYHETTQNWERWSRAIETALRRASGARE